MKKKEHKIRTSKIRIKLFATIFAVLALFFVVITVITSPALFAVLSSRTYRQSTQAAEQIKACIPGSVNYYYDLYVISVNNNIDFEILNPDGTIYYTSSRDSIHGTSHFAASGANDVLLSVDAFHQETIPLSPVIRFAPKIKEYGVPIRLQPAWLVSKDDKNPYNEKTREILDKLSYLQIPESDGNFVFPEGTAKKYLAQYFTESSPENPYTEDPCNVKCLSFSPNGDLLDSNVYENDVMDIIKNYTP